MEPVFVFDDPPSLLMVYGSMDEARGSVKSLDVSEGQPAFTVTGRVVDVRPTENLFARLELTEWSDLPRLQALLRGARGPTHLADDRWNTLSNFSERVA